MATALFCPVAILLVNKSSLSKAHSPGKRATRQEPVAKQA